ncbi:T-complex protein 1 subunit beta [Fonsecaea monophora]|uniref:T-complex protein 1 subunit beta n=1 Tax=Fonsecaea monophora TaxID=254056 RepID=A0A177ERR1_9EURO|nr:T-complex protein 1 subunit beta [Fonsecaea monophora]OAG33980.1 T-complex protein 1 subunit beta [Fonsecaea monophora]
MSEYELQRQHAEHRAVDRDQDHARHAVNAIAAVREHFVEEITVIKSVTGICILCGPMIEAMTVDVQIDDFKDSSATVSVGQAQDAGHNREAQLDRHLEDARENPQTMHNGGLICVADSRTLQLTEPKAGDKTCEGKVYSDAIAKGTNWVLVRSTIGGVVTVWAFHHITYNLDSDRHR